MAAENESLTREPATRGRGRGGRGGRAGRGRGGGRGAATLSGGITKSTYTKTGRGGTRRGRAKSFADSRVQAAYERQRDLKANYQAVAHALKPALQELADRAIEEILARSDSLRFSSEHLPVLQELHDRLEEKLKLFDRQLEANLKLAEGTYDAEQYVLEQEFIVRPFSFHPYPRRVFSPSALPFFYTHSFRGRTLADSSPSRRMVFRTLKNSFTTVKVTVSAFLLRWNQEISQSM